MPGGRSALVHHFEVVVQRDPDRVLIHVPATATSARARDIWDAHLRYAQQLTDAGVGRHQLVLSAVGNHSEAIGLLLAVRAIDAALLSVDAGTTSTEIFQLADRFDASALILPDVMCDTGSAHRVVDS